MPETIQTNGLWHVMLVEKDLVEQAGLNKDDFEQNFGFLEYKNRPVIVSHIFNEHLVVSIEGQEDQDLEELMNAFSTVVGYQPFCKYILLLEETPPLPTYEWDKIDSNARYQELEAKDTVSDLTRI